MPFVKEGGLFVRTSNVYELMIQWHFLFVFLMSLKSIP